MRTRPIMTIFITLAAGGLAILAIIGVFRHLLKPSPILTGYLSLHEMHIPSDSALWPEILRGRLSRDAIGLWLDVEGRRGEAVGPILDEVADYLETHVTADLGTDPLFRYTHYYRLIIENEGEKPFEKVFVRFPEVASVEVRRSRLEGNGEYLIPIEGKYQIGEIEPGGDVTVFGWSTRPFYAQEERDVVLGHAGGLSEVLFFKTEKPVNSWIRQNIILLVIFVSLILLLLHKMVVTVSTCVKSLDPDLEERTEI